MRHRSYDRHPGCPIEMCSEIIGGKWKGPILYYLMEGTKRFGELRRLLPEVTQRMLTMQLRELEEHGVIERKVYAEIPPKVEYSVSPTGASLQPIIALMKQWGNEYLRIHAQPTPPEQVTVVPGPRKPSRVRDVPREKVGSAGRTTAKIRRDAAGFAFQPK
jgi:DNA-binding HxlR family transcriptional regulator